MSGPGEPTSSANPNGEVSPPSRVQRDLVLGGGAVLIIFVLVLVISGPIRHWFALHTGVIHGGPDPYYNFWSGFGSDLGEATLISAVLVGVYTGVRKANCHVKGCWRIGHHPIDGTPYVVCKHHHPEVPSGGVSHEHILGEYVRGLERRITSPKSDETT
jgi:hypothetical protein